MSPGGGVLGGGVGLGHQDGCKRRTEVFVKIQKKKFFGWGGGGVRVDVNQELKFFGKFKKNWGAGGLSPGGGIRGGGGGRVGGSGWM